MRLIYRHIFSKIKKLEGGVCTRICDVLRRFFRIFDTSMHTERTRNGDVLETPVRNVAGPDKTEGSLYKRDRWATQAEGRIDRGEVPTPSRLARPRTFGELVDLHINDMKSAEKVPRHSKAATLKMLKVRLGGKKIVQLDPQLFIDFGRERAREGAGPMTLSIDIGAIKLILSYAAAVHGLTVSIEAIDRARFALKRLGLVGEGIERDRRPSEEELERLISYFEKMPRQTIPMAAIIRFVVATAMRQEEIFKVVWDDYAARTRMLTIRDRKDPREKTGSDQRIPCCQSLVSIPSR